MITYKITMLGATLSDPYQLLAMVFPHRNGETAWSDGSSVCVTFDAPQNPTDLGPLVRIEVIPNP